jgi:hypothetical protein
MMGMCFVPAKTRGLCPLDPRWGEPPQTCNFKEGKEGGIARRAERKNCMPPSWPSPGQSA